MRKFFLVAGVLVIAVALAVVPMPFFELEPGGTLSVEARVELSGLDDVDDIDGELLLTTVRLGTPSALEVVGTWFDDEADLVARRAVVPEGVDADEYRRQQLRVFEESSIVAAVVAQRAAGMDVTIEVELLEDEIGGPSAGLMLALTVYELIDDSDLVAGRTIAGTGTIDTTGAVGRVRGVAQKARAAEEAGADIFLAPAAEADKARAIAGPDLEIIAVETFQDALDALRSRGS